LLSFYHSATPEIFAVCKLAGPEMLWRAVDDLVQLLGRRGVVETQQVRSLVEDARVLRGLEGPTEAAAARLGLALLEVDGEPLKRLISEGFGNPALEPLVDEAAAALCGAAASIGDAGMAGPSYWLQARAGELTTWLVLLAAVERRRKQSTPDLDRTARWLRSSVENVISQARLGPPPDVQAAIVGDTIATYDRSVGGLELSLGWDERFSANGRAPRSLPPSVFPVSTAAESSLDRRGRLRAWALALLAQRLSFGGRPIDLRRSFADLGVDVPTALAFVQGLADRLGVPFAPSLLGELPSVDAVLDYLIARKLEFGPGAPTAEFGVSASAPRDAFTFVRELVRRGGPEPWDDAQFEHWFAEVTLLIAKGLLTVESVHAFWKGLGPTYLTGSLNGRALAKHYGYAGDFSIIDDIYLKTASSNPALRNWDLFFQCQAAPRAVRNRKAYFHSVMESTVTRVGPRARVLLLGCGPARDIAEFLRVGAHQSVQVLAVDRDPHALEYAAGVCKAEGVTVELRQADVLRFAPTEAFDLIWAAGLFDYLSDGLFVRLLKRFRSSMLPNGEMIIGNFCGDHATRSAMDLVCDWALNYRSASDLATLASRAGFEPERVRIGAEPEGINLFLHLSAPATSP
ncbi:MAG: hypothetical protein RL685_5428, partial [Pseudomonadota bacterium]